MPGEGVTWTPPHERLQGCPPPWGTPSLISTHSALQQHPHSSLSGPHHQPGKVPAAAQAMCFQAKPSPVFVLPPSALLCNQSETLPAAARGQESLGESAAVSPKCPPPLHSLPPHHWQSPTGQTDTGQAVARHCPLARKTSALLHRGGQAKGGSATGLPTGWSFPVIGSNDISSCPPWPLGGGGGTVSPLGT